MGALLRVPRIRALLLAPALAMFVSANVANAGNLLFNMLFSRWMGPELFADLATLLTVKLSLLALLNAVQMAVSQVVSTDRDGGATVAWANRVLFVALGLAVPLLVPLSLTGALAGWLGLGSAPALTLLIFALPVTAPLCLARGVALGRMQVGAMIWSTNLEMAVRLGGAVAAWTAGLGLTGVVLALAASLVAGWWPLRGVVGPVGRVHAPTLRRIGVLALPFAVLQAAQVGHLDGDVVVANLVLTKAEAGLVAVLSLVQRIQFFACFGLAAVLLPVVSAAVAAGRSGLVELRPVALLFAGVSLPLLAVLALAPETVLGLLAGPAFAAAAPHLALVGLAAVLFTVSYLGATFLAACGDRRGIWAMAAFVPVQIGLYLLGPPDLAALVTTKTQVQSVLAALILGLTALRIARAGGRHTVTEYPA